MEDFIEALADELEKRYGRENACLIAENVANLLRLPFEQEYKELAMN